jgi:hypothetical protein
MLPRTVFCEQCAQPAMVRGYGRVEYDWAKAGTQPGNIEIHSVRLTVDCPRCGVRTQDYHPVPASHQLRSHEHR